MVYLLSRLFLSTLQHGIRATIREASMSSQVQFMIIVSCIKRLIFDYVLFT